MFSRNEACIKSYEGDRVTLNCLPAKRCSQEVMELKI